MYSVSVVQKIRTESLTGIVLRSISVGEADRLVIIVTRERGKFKCLARGVRKPEVNWVDF